MIATSEFKLKKNKNHDLDHQQVFVRVKWPRQEGLSREALIAGKNGSGRIYAVTSLNNEWIMDEEMQAIDKAIAGGEPLHEVFVRNGYSVRKNILDVYVISLTHLLCRQFNTVQTFARAQNAEYIVRKGDTVYCYGIVKQIYSPEIWPAALTDSDKDSINFSFQTLQSCGFSREEIWRLMDDDHTGWLADQRIEGL